jgi:hypothetical protein
MGNNRKIFSKNYDKAFKIEVEIYATDLFINPSPKHKCSVSATSNVLTISAIYGVKTEHIQDLQIQPMMNLSHHTETTSFHKAYTMFCLFELQLYSQMAGIGIRELLEVAGTTCLTPSASIWSTTGQ